MSINFIYRRGSDSALIKYYITRLSLKINTRSMAFFASKFTIGYSAYDLNIDICRNN